jgi:hypothetical protein
VNKLIERRYLGLALLAIGTMAGATAVLLLQCKQRTARAGERKADHDTRSGDMVAEGGPVMDDVDAT